jgi:hypothetical protein
LAYYAGDGEWKSVLVTKMPGTYKSVLFRNEKAVTQTSNANALTVQTEVPKGFVRIKGTKFQFDSGEGYLPLGINIGWQNGDLPPIVETIKKLGDAGGNWNRIWACHWDGKNPWWTPDKPLRDGEFSQNALQKWDEVLSASEKHGQYSQVVLFHHGPWSSRVNSNWKENPWNAEQKGFLKNPADFFTDPEAKRRSKMWLRYAVARYAHYPSVMAWELFNEVQWVDARYDKRWSDIAAWHKEMAAYLRELDPYDHLVTSSSDPDDGTEEDLYGAMDYYQPHTYPANVLAAIGRREFKPDKPGFFGEFGPPNGADVAQGIRDGIYGGVLAGHAGAGQYWFWDRVEKENFFPIFARAKAFLTVANVLAHPEAKPIEVPTESGAKTALAFRPGIGWGKSRRGSFRLPEDWRFESEVSSYLQGASGGNREMYVPWEFRANLSAASTALVRVSNVARGGAKLRALVNGSLVAQKDWGVAGQDQPGTQIEIPLPAGEVTLRLENEGADWVNIASVDIPMLADASRAHGMGDSKWAALRLITEAGLNVRVRGLPLPDGAYSATMVNLVEAGEQTATVELRNGSLTIKAPFREFGVILSPAP